MTHTTSESTWPRKISAISLFVEDLEATKRSYRDVFRPPVSYENDNSAVFTFGNTIINLLKTLGGAIVGAAIAVILRRRRRRVSRRRPAATGHRARPGTGWCG
ncbi:hypothetical protein [Streptomyces antibioticus]|uniref:hypothetical protein n=1 Tax=Streptomyces antibioticus TaxID=1890 RepID=UPI0033FD5FA2